MCGIVGYVGRKNAVPFLIEGLRALEYRGYDSAGIYIAGAGVTKRSGKVEVLAQALPADLAGTVGIAHTRWATHGAPTETNAHPHTDDLEQIWLVHNGIIENYVELRAALRSEGVTFRSETDTEVLAQLIGRYYCEHISLEQAVRKALADTRGTYGVVVTSLREPDTLIAARLGSPLMLGIGDNEFFIGSDATPILPHTREVIYLEDGDVAVINPQGYRVTNLQSEPKDNKIERLEWDTEAAQKKGYEHFMLKEIMEIPQTIEHTLRGRLRIEEGTAHLGGLQEILPRLASVKRVIITGCGSAYYAGLLGEYLIEELAGIPVEVEIASELRHRRPTTDAAETLLIAISQSGETADTLEAVRESKRHNMLTVGVVNVVGSTIARETHAGVYNHAGPEIGVASTKAFVSQVVVLALIALLLGRSRAVSREDGEVLVAELSRLSTHAQEVLDSHEAIALIAKKYADSRDFLYLGRKFQYPVAYEGALKLKEVSYVHAEGYGAGEMKHGPLALIDSAFPTLVLAPVDSVYEKTRSNIQEIKARGGPVIAVTTHGNDAMHDLADDVIFVPKVHEMFQPVLTTVALQLFAYHVAHERGLPIDQPRNLAKAVTVE